MGVPFVLSCFIGDEPRPVAESEREPAKWVEYLARYKAQRCGWPHAQARLILTADTVVWHDGAILNKPVDTADAIAMLQRLRGQTHTVFTGICLRERLGKEGLPEEDGYNVTHGSTRVTFGEVSDGWIEKYVATGEPMDKAGAYAAQGRGAVMVEEIDGDFWNVVGLPIYKTARMLETAGLPVEQFWLRER